MTTLCWSARPARAPRRPSKPCAGRQLANVHVLDGGMTAWQGTGFEVNRGVQRWDLERQVRLAAGSVVLASVLASVVAPKLKWLAGVAGGGLVFAAVSNSCAMGRLLARLPYNRGPSFDVDTVASQLAHPRRRRVSKMSALVLGPPCA